MVCGRDPEAGRLVDRSPNQYGAAIATELRNSRGHCVAIAK